MRVYVSFPVALDMPKTNLSMIADTSQRIHSKIYMQSSCTNGNFHLIYVYAALSRHANFKPNNPHSDSVQRLIISRLALKQFCSTFFSGENYSFQLGLA